MHSPGRALWRLLILLLAIIVVATCQSLLLRLSPRRANTATLRWHRMFCSGFGLEVGHSGDICAGPSTLFVANHTSYADIPALGSLVTGAFVAKGEIADWPVFGFMAGLQRTIFVARQARHSAGQRDQLGDRLREGGNVILFPEGTSNDGTHTLPFKSALFSVAAVDTGHGPVQVQPVSLAYTGLDGIPLGRYLRPFIAWYGDMDLVPHAWMLMGLGRIRVQIRFHPVVTLEEFGSRKALAEHCQRVVASGVASLISGRAAPPPALPAPVEGAPA